MRNRAIKKQFWLNRKEAEALKRNAKKCGLSQTAFIRFLITGYLPHEAPPLAYHDLIRELRAVGNNLNQLAKAANTTGKIDTATYQQEASRLYQTILKIQEAVLLPDRIERLSLKEKHGHEYEKHPDKDEIRPAGQKGASESA